AFAVYQVLSVFIIGMPAAKKKLRASSTKRVVCEEINPFVGAIDTYLYFKDRLLERMYQRYITAMSKKKARTLEPTAKRRRCPKKRTFHNMLYSIITYILMHDNPVVFIHSFVKSRLAEYHMLELMFERLDMGQLIKAFSTLTPDHDRTVLDKVLTNHCGKVDAIKQAMKELVAGKIKQSPSQFIGSSEERMHSEDMLAHFSLRCGEGGYSIQQELIAILDAIYAEVEKGTRFYFKYKTMASFIYNIVVEKYRKRNIVLAGPALDYITSRYSKNFIYMLTRQYPVQGPKQDKQDTIKSRVMNRIISHTCSEDISRGDPCFVRGYLGAQRKKGMITEPQEAEYLYTYFCNNDQSKRDKLFVIDGNFPEPLPFEFRRRVVDYLYEEICASNPDIAAAVQTRYDSSPDKNANSLYQAKFDACLAYYQALAQTANAAQGSACSPCVS
ncbi:hypothetical protein PAPHI01_2234, partial [Pancytospora philotis]